MIRFLVSLGFFLITFLCEVSFFSSLPSFFALTPLVFCISIYLIQHEGMVDGLIWMVLYGILLDVFHLASFPVSTIAWVITALVSSLMARHVFSNRSFYGVLGCAIGGFICLILGEGIILFVSALMEKTFVDWFGFLHTLLPRFGMMFLTMSILFSAASRMRSSRLLL